MRRLCALQQEALQLIQKIEIDQKLQETLRVDLSFFSKRGNQICGDLSNVVRSSSEVIIHIALWHSLVLHICKGGCSVSPMYRFVDFEIFRGQSRIFRTGEVGTILGIHVFSMPYDIVNVNDARCQKVQSTKPVATTIQYVLPHQ